MIVRVTIIRVTYRNGYTRNPPLASEWGVTSVTVTIRNPYDCNPYDHNPYDCNPYNCNPYDM